MARALLRAASGLCSAFFRLGAAGGALPPSQRRRERRGSRKDWNLDLEPCNLERRCDPVISRFVDAGVRFLIVGSWAVRFHGYIDRKVNDLDVLVELSAGNWPTLASVLHDHFAIAVRPFDEVSRGQRPFQNKDLDPVHILTAIGSAFESGASCAPSRGPGGWAVASRVRGVSFGGAWSDGVEATFGAKGLRVRVPSKAHLIISKEHSSRAVDIRDLKRLLEPGAG